MTPGKKVSDSQLATEIKKSQKKAFDQLFERYSQALYRFSKSLLKNHEDAEGVVQEVFFRIWKKRKSIDISRSFSSYLFSIAHNVVIDQIRKRVKEQKYEEFVIRQAQVSYLNPEDEMEFNELKLIVEDVVAELPERRKQIYRLSREEGLSHKEIAGRMNIQAKTVENQLNLALKQIRSRLGKQTLSALLFASLFI
jgi:RNA polymerase sigma-19 factor, ECF subfamily